jgi:RNA polymerase sigma-70 factor (ECF subfamily)
MDDTGLAGRLAADPDSAFPDLVAGHQDRLYAIALRLLGDPADAEEVVQDALVRAYRAILAYPADRTRALRLRPWLAAIAVNQARNRRRRIDERRPPQQLVVEDGDVVGRPERERSAETAAIERAERARWGALLAALPDRYRVPLVLRYIDDLSFAEMAEALDRPEGTLKAQVHRGLARLRDAWLAQERQEDMA